MMLHFFSLEERIKMAETGLPLEVKRIKDPRIDVMNKVYYANQGGVNITQYKIDSTTRLMYF